MKKKTEETKIQSDGVSTNQGQKKRTKSNEKVICR